MKAAARFVAPLAILLSAMAIVSAAYATGVADGEAGLAALGRGSFDEAIRLFTRALKAHDLSADDREFAYLNRAKAYLGKGDTVDAAADLHSALALKPDDADAQSALAQITAGPPRAPVDQATEQQTKVGGFGLLAAMAGRYYWYQLAGGDPHSLVLHFQWTTADKTLSAILRSKSNLNGVYEYQLDDVTGKLLFVGDAGNIIYYGTSEATDDSLTTYQYFKSIPDRDRLTRLPDGSVKRIEQQYRNGRWQNASEVLLVEVPEAEAEAQGFVKRK